MKRSSVINGIVLGCAVIEAEHLLIDVTLKVEGFDGHVGAIQTTLEAGPSVITLKPAIRYQFKTGQRDWPKT